MHHLHRVGRRLVQAGAHHSHDDHHRHAHACSGVTPSPRPITVGISTKTHDRGPGRRRPRGGRRHPAQRAGDGCEPEGRERPAGVGRLGHPGGTKRGPYVFFRNHTTNDNAIPFVQVWKLSAGRGRGLVRAGHVARRDPADGRRARHRGAALVLPAADGLHRPQLPAGLPIPWASALRAWSGTSTRSRRRSRPGQEPAPAPVAVSAPPAAAPSAVCVRLRTRPSPPAGCRTRSGGTSTGTGTAPAGPSTSPTPASGRRRRPAAGHRPSRAEFPRSALRRGCRRRRLELLTVVPAPPVEPDRGRSSCPTLEFP